MDGPSGLNQPRRKSRLRSREVDYTRRPDVPGTVEPSSEGQQEEAPFYDPSLESQPSFVSAETGILPASIDQAAPGAADADEDDELPEAFQLKKVYTEPPPPRHPLTDWRWLLALLLLLSAGVVGGYLLGQQAAPPPGVSPRVAFIQANRAVLGPLDPKVQQEVDDAFEATKKGTYPDARQRFIALREKHPEWPSMAVEAARAALYEHDSQQAQGILGVLIANRLTPDADFMTALLHLTNKEFDLAEVSFGTATALDPARADFYFFWGECLRRDGKPQEAIDKFRSALLRNQYENAEGLFQLKLWLSEIQADKEESSGAGKEIDAALALPRPTYAALFAAAGRAIKAARYAEAARFMAKAREVMEPAVFLVILQDPTFLEESTRPELAPFYR